VKDFIAMIVDITAQPLLIYQRANHTTTGCTQLQRTVQQQQQPAA
jgi:hypothetical protein